jgi:hypothetical protein
LAATAAGLAFALTMGGCSLSYKLEGFSAKDDSVSERTASVKPPKPADKASPGRLPPDQDLALAKAAVHDLLSRGGQETSLPWENPRTGARGTVTPIAEAYTQDGFTCRDFLASYVRGKAESWLQGEACRIHEGKWEVRSLRPLNPA